LATSAKDAESLSGVMAVVFELVWAGETELKLMIEMTIAIADKEFANSLPVFDNINTSPLNQKGPTQ
jgi:hypothetical protein